MKKEKWYYSKISEAVNIVNNVMKIIQIKMCVQ